jgi:hypothetical protein
MTGAIEYLRTHAANLTKAFDLRDLFVFGGIAMMGYGLWLYQPWIAFTVCGATIFRLGFGPLIVVKRS